VLSSLDVRKSDPGKVRNRNIKVQKIERGVRDVLNGIYEESGRATPRNDGGMESAKDPRWAQN